MKNGQRQSKQPTKKELAKKRIYEAVLLLERLEGAVLEASDAFEDEHIPINLLKINLDFVRLDKDADLPKEWIVNWNKMLDAFYAQSEKYCFTNRDKEGNPINLPMDVFSVYINEVKTIIKNS